MLVHAELFPFKTCVICNGGQQVPDIQTKINALLLNRITQVLKGNNSAWTSIFSYLAS
jgi:hypothetical protein